MKPHFLFSHFSKTVAQVTGKPSTFLVALAVIVLWAVTGPLFHYSDTWQLVINTSTTIITFLMVFLIQNTQNRDTEALQLKLDELIRAVTTANNDMLDIEDLDQEGLDKIRDTYLKLAREGRLPAHPLEAG